MAHAHSYLVLTEDIKTEYLRDTFSYENHSQNLYKTKRSNKRYRTYIYYILRFVVETWAVTTLQDKRAFEGYEYMSIMNYGLDFQQIFISFKSSDSKSSDSRNDRPHRNCQIRQLIFILRI